MDLLAVEADMQAILSLFLSIMHIKLSRAKIEMSTEISLVNDCFVTGYFQTYK